MRQAVECDRLAIAMSAMRKVKIIAVVLVGFFFLSVFSMIRSYGNI